MVIGKVFAIDKGRGFLTDVLFALSLYSHAVPITVRHENEPLNKVRLACLPFTIRSKMLTEHDPDVPDLGPALTAYVESPLQFSPSPPEKNPPATVGNKL